MARIFNMDNPFWRFMGKLVDVVILHFIWLICSLPLFTFGAATTALYYAMMKDLKDEDSHYVKAFFRSFKLNFKQGIPLGLIFLFGSALMLLSINLYFSAESTSSLPKILGYILVAVYALFFFMYEYAFPMMARFDNTVKNTLKNGILLAIRHVGWTILMALIFAAVYFVAFYLTFWPILIFGFGLVVMLDCYILNRVLEPYIKKASGEDDKEEDPDRWEIPDEIPDSSTESAEGVVNMATIEAARNTITEGISQNDTDNDQKAEEQ